MTKMNREKLYEKGAGQLVSMVTSRLSRSTNLPDDWREDALRMLDSIREDCIDWLTASHTAMNRAREEASYKRQKRKEASGV